MSNPNDSKLPLRLLLAEDCSVQTRLVEFIVEDLEGAELVTAVRDGPDVLSYLREQADAADGALPDLILLDINMPTMDGFEVLDEIRGDSRFEKIPVVMLTASNDEQCIAKSYKHGANTFLEKPMDADKMTEVITQCVGYWNQAKLP